MVSGCFVLYCDSAFSVRYLSKKAYTHMKYNMGIPLQGLSTLANLASKINIQPGVQNHFIENLGALGFSMDQLDKLTVLLFDEMKTKEVYEFDIKGDKVYSPKKQMLVVMARGLIGNWKQIVYIDFDQRFKSLKLNEIIGKLYLKKFLVVAVVCDCYSGNRNVWKENGVNFINPDRTYFTHDESQQKIFFFADAPHILKLSRNWLLDTGFLWEGVKFNSEPIKKLISHQREVSSTFKLSAKHIECVGQGRQNVRLAAQLISSTTAKAVLHFMPSSNDEASCRKLSEYLSLTNNWFDVMNSYVPENSTNKYKSAFGKYLDNQTEVLQQFFEMMSYYIYWNLIGFNMISRRHSWILINCHHSIFV